MAGRVILAIDQGTTGTTTYLIDRAGQMFSRGYCAIEQHYPRPGWVEHDPNQIWASVLDASRQTLEQAGFPDLAAIGIANQRETTILWDRRTGAPIGPAVVWQCRRTAPLCQELKRSGLEAMFRAKTGLVLDAYFSGPKIQWLLDRKDSWRSGAQAGEVCFGTVDSWLVWKLTGGTVHATDSSNASRTLLYDIGNGRWDAELCRILRVPMAALPEVKPSSGVVGQSVECRNDAGQVVIPAGVQIAGVAGDQHAALFGQTCFGIGDTKATLGTGAFVLMNTGSQIHTPPDGLLSTMAWRLGDHSTYALEGSVFSAGATIQWLRDELGLIESAGESDELASSVGDSGGVYLVPAFVGLGAPHWDMHARGAILGLTRGSSRAHLVRAGLEAIAFQVRDVVEVVSRETGLRIETLRVDGGASANEFLAQFLADQIDVEVVRPKYPETTALGAGYLAGLGVGYWESIDELSEMWEVDRIYRPQIKPALREQLYTGWLRAVERAKGWATDS